MANPYFELFQIPGTRAFVLAGVLARLPASMSSIGLITMLSQAQGGYGLAGSVAAVFALSAAFFAPQISRLVDRHSQGVILPIAALISGSALLMLLLCSHIRAPIWALFVFAVLAGCIPSISSMTRARWTELYRGQPQLQTAFALESTLDEVCFIIGPPISVGLSVGLFPEAGLLAAALLLMVSVNIFALQNSTEPPVHAHLKHCRGGLIFTPLMLSLINLMLALGVIVGVVDVVSVAFAQLQGKSAAATITLAAYSIGSCIAGIAFGALKRTAPLSRQLLYCCVATTLSTWPLLWVTNVSELAVAFFSAGLFLAPTLIVSMAIVEQVVPASQLTEGMTWLITGLNIGVSVGTASSGWMIEHFGAFRGPWVALAAGVLITGTAVLVYQQLSFSTNY